MVKYSVESILGNIFYDDVYEVVDLLKENGFYGIVQSQIDYFQENIKKQQNFDFNIVSMSFLTQINNKLLCINDDELKEDIKYYLTNIGNYIIDSFIKKNQLSKSQLFDLKNQLQLYFEHQGFDFKDLDKRVQFNRLINFATDDTTETEKQKSAYYEWLGNDNLLIELTDNLYSEKIIKSKKDFKKLFTNSPVKLMVNNSQKDFVVILFDELYSKNIIKPREKKGQFSALKECAVDFENNFLFKKQMKSIKYSITKNKEKHGKLKKKANNWIADQSIFVD